jgi:hypothetical protein
MFGKGAFTIDPNATPEQIAQKRAYIAAMMPKFGKASYVGEGLGQLASGVMIGRQNKKLDATESAGRKSAADMFAGLVGTGSTAPGSFGVLGAAPTDSASSSSAPAPEATPIPGGPLAGAVMPASGGHDHSVHAGQTHSEWLKYSNQSAKRNDPLDENLVNAMSFVGDMGITMDVISGGQEPAGTPGGTRTGSTRHDHGKSADVDFYKDGRKLDWNNPADLPLLTEIVQTAKANGVTGIGAGDDYMGAGRFHVGFGAPAVWGAGGKSANAPAWLVEAYNGAPAGSAPQGVTASAKNGGQPTPVSTGGGIPTDQLLAAMSNPWLSQQERAVLSTLYDQQVQASDPLRQLQIAQAEAELAKMNAPPAPPEDFTNRMFMLNSLGIDPQSEEGQSYILTGKMPEEPEAGARPLTDPAERASWGIPPTDTRPYAIEPGKRPQVVGGDGQTINVNTGGTGPDLGKLSTDYGYVLDPETGQAKIDPTTGLPVAAPVPGSPAALEAASAEEKARLRDAQSAASADIVLQDIDKAIDQTSGWTAGMGSLLGALPGTPARDLEGSLNTIKANIGFDRLQQMREASPTGGALGGIAVPELVMLQAVLGSLTTDQSPEQLKANLQRLKEVYAPIAAKAAAYPNADQFGFSGGQGGAVPAEAAIPEGIDPADWEYMTPEERALFQ